MYIRNFFIPLIGLLVLLGTIETRAQIRIPRDTAKQLQQNITPQQFQQLQQGLSNPPKTSVSPTETPAVERKEPEITYQSFSKPPSSNVFGSEFFNSSSLSFEPNLRIPTPSNYVLGPDDELLVTVSGYQETNLKTPVQPEGTIFIPQVGSINVSGLSIETATARIKDRMAQTAYPSLKSNLSKLVVSLGKIKSIRITIIGAFKPGNYTVSSLSTVFNSLYLCGGPGAIHTYRDIELIRNGKVYQKIDIYQFLTRGDQKGNVLLKEGDVINFPVYKKQVTISGQVKRPGIFELKEGENFDNLLFFAGGYTVTAFKATVKVKQVTDTERRIKDLSKAEIMVYQPSNGDSFTVDAVLERVENSVGISGPVFRPGEFELTPGTTISMLIKRAGGLMENVYTERAILTRTHVDGTIESIPFNVTSVMNGGVGDISLIKRDAISISTLNEFIVPYKVIIEGEVKKPGTFDYSQNLSLKDVFFKAGGFTDAAYLYNIEVSRRLTKNSATVVVDSIALVYTISTTNSFAIENDKFILQPFDIIRVRRNPGYVEQKRVTINGEVNFPGAFTIQSKNERVSDMLKRAGGLTPFAYLKGIYLTRQDVNDNAKQQEEIVRNLQRTIRDTSTKIIYDVARTNARIPINFQKLIDDPTGIENYVLLDGDIIEVLKLDPLVKVSGEVLSATRTGYSDNKQLNYYISQAGGTNIKARRSKIYVLYADGHVRRTKNGFFGLFRSYPKIETGAEIVVPRKAESTGLKPTEVLSISTGIISLVTLVVVAISNLRK
jgi:prepilin-type processing-associated H-X9-DG protein